MAGKLLRVPQRAAGMISVFSADRLSRAHFAAADLTRQKNLQRRRLVSRQVR
jgi:hypothetical protein